MKEIDDIYPWLLGQICILCLPVIVLIITMGLLGFSVEDLRVKPEWGFITIVLFAEALKDALHYSREKNDGKTVIDARVSFSITFITVSSIILFASIAFDLKKAVIRQDALLILQLTMFGSGIALCSYYKYLLKKVDKNY
jgi:hypothetical protein